MSITKAEKETVILFDEADACAEVYTHNTKLKEREKNRNRRAACGSTEWTQYRICLSFGKN